MADLTLTKSGEFMVVHVEAQTEEGVEFLDAYNPLDLVVVDSGRVIVPEDGLWALQTLATERGLTWEEEVA